jgi:hypothetical protein
LTFTLAVRQQAFKTTHTWWNSPTFSITGLPWLSISITFSSCPSNVDRQWKLNSHDRTLEIEVQDFSSPKKRESGFPPGSSFVRFDLLFVNYPARLATQGLAQWVKPSASHEVRFSAFRFFPIQILTRFSHTFWPWTGEICLFSVSISLIYERCFSFHGGYDSYPSCQLFGEISLLFKLISNSSSLFFNFWYFFVLRRIWPALSPISYSPKSPYFSSCLLFLFIILWFLTCFFVLRRIWLRWLPSVTHRNPLIFQVDCQYHLLIFDLWPFFAFCVLRRIWPFWVISTAKRKKGSEIKEW